MTRKIIQISATKGAYEDYDEDNVFALCDDGTLWCLWRSSEENEGKWYALPPIPQKKDEGQ